MPMLARSLLAVVALVAGASVNSAQAAWKEKVLHDFSSADTGGFRPNVGVMVAADGAVYGSAFTSKEQSNGTFGDGVIYRYAGGKFTVIFAFDNSKDICGRGRNPSAVLVMDSAGALYGTTFLSGKDGSNGGGIIFKLKKRNGNWACQVLHTFSKAGPASSNEGYNPFGGLLLAEDGTLYGTAQAGGHFGGGVVFSLTPGSNTYTVLHYFSSKNPSDNPSHNLKDGYTPAGRLVGDPTDALYGATFFGGVNNGGVIYKLMPANPNSFQVLYRFPHHFNADIPAPNGYQPAQNGLAIDTAGNLVGETTLGGQKAGAATNGGLVFKLNPNSKAFSILHVFNVDSGDGFNPIGGFVTDSSDNFFGVTQSGGTDGGGAIFKIRNKNYSVLYNFSGNDDGGLPNGPLGIDANGALFGTTYAGGASGGGVLFKLTQ